MKSRKEAIVQFARKLWPKLNPSSLYMLYQLCERHQFSLERGDLIPMDSGWYVTHTGLLSLAHRNHCCGIAVRPLQAFCNPQEHRYSFEATVYKSKTCRGFCGVGDADPSNVSAAMHGAEMRIAETRAVNRALRKAYGIGLCSVEELGSAPVPPNGNAKRAAARLGANLEVVTPVPLRDQLRQLIRQYRLDPVLTKTYALDHLGVKSLRDATREQVSELITHLQKRLFEDRDQFLAELAKCTVPKDHKEVA